ncbi:MAG: phosphonate ABC transporter, permease protein PhnE [Lachnospiraceae bacterium]|nr:phosphonate ABC transporter, permease protein PhnE [Lachnospiraceae bacterium]MDD3795331.1 phosphonate ABC transporter, permease protein PhnE [Lachnospiraceae bacterium]
MKLKDTVHFQWYKTLFIVCILLVCIGSAVHVTEADFVEVFSNVDQMTSFMSRFLKPDFTYILKIWEPMLLTIKMSVTGTVLGVAFAVPFAFLATTIVTKNRIVTMVIRFFLDIIRTIPNLLLAALLVAIVGIGEFTGVLTIAVFTFGMVSQLIYEAIETIDYGPIEAAESIGANKIQTAVWSVLPQVLNQIASYTLYALEVNVRASTVLGYVGAGGIGVILNSSLALLRYDRVSVVILMILIVVVIVDGLSEAIRRRLS